MEGSEVGVAGGTGRPQPTAADIGAPRTSGSHPSTSHNASSDGSFPFVGIPSQTHSSTHQLATTDGKATPKGASGEEVANGGPATTANSTPSLSDKTSASRVGGDDNTQVQENSRQSKGSANPETHTKRAAQRDAALAKGAPGPQPAGKQGQPPAAEDADGHIQQANTGTRSKIPLRLANVFNNDRPLTTRAPRPNEKQGREYNFVSREEFMALLDAGEVVEYGERNGILYGSINQVVSPEERSAAKQSLDAQLAKVRSRHNSASAPPETAVVKKSPKPSPTTARRMNPPPARSSAPAPQRVRKAEQFQAPEGVYVENESRCFSARLTRKDLGNLTPPASRLRHATVQGHEVFATLIRGYVTWYEDGRRVGILDDHDLGGHPCAIDVGETIEEAATAKAEKSQQSEKTDLSLVLGLTNGEVVVYFSRSRAMQVYNAGRSRMCASACLSVEWTTRTTFIVTHANGAIFLYDMTVNDAEHQPEVGSFQSTSRSARSANVERPLGQVNPVRTWKHVSTAVTAVALSKHHSHVAAGDKQGNLWVCDLRSDEGLLLSRQKVSYFGAIISTAWSSDGDFVAVGAQDDLVTIWSLSQQSVVARGIGHTSWVASVAFDDTASRLPRQLRVVSSGHDGKLLLWDFEHDLNEMPKQVARTVPEMTPVAEHVVSGNPVTAVLCTNDGILTASTVAEVLWWARPSRLSSRVASLV